MEVKEIVKALNNINEDLEDEGGICLDVQLYKEDDQLHLYLAAENCSGADYTIADADEAGTKFAEYLKKYVL